MAGKVGSKTFFAACTFDIRDPAPAKYESAYQALRVIGLSRITAGASGEPITLPPMTCIGLFDGNDPATLRGDLCARIQATFRRLGLAASIFVVVSGDWSWGQRES